MDELREIGQLALTDGDVDVAWAFTFLAGRADLDTGVRVDDAELALLPSGLNVRAGLRELAQLGMLEIRIEREGRQSQTWSAFLPE